MYIRRIFACKKVSVKIFKRDVRFCDALIYCDNLNLEFLVLLATFGATTRE